MSKTASRSATALRRVTTMKNFLKFVDLSKAKERRSIALTDMCLTRAGSVSND